MDLSKARIGLFEGTARYYSRYRTGYPAEAIDTLIRRFSLTANTTVLDLGCGTGQIALPLAGRGIRVIGVDPDIEMLAEALRVEQESGVTGIAWMRGNDATLEALHLSALTLCTMGASFHWMDRDSVLAELDSLVLPNGGLAIFSGGSVWKDRRGDSDGAEDRSWETIVKDTIVEFLGPDRRAGTGTYNHPVEGHEVVLARSAFRKLERFTFTTPHSITAEGIIGLQLSTSYASPAQLGSNLDKLIAILQSRLCELNPSGIFPGETSTELLIASR